MKNISSETQERIMGVISYGGAGRSLIGNWGNDFSAPTLAAKTSGGGQMNHGSYGDSGDSGGYVGPTVDWGGLADCVDVSINTGGSGISFNAGCVVDTIDWDSGDSDDGGWSGDADDPGSC